MTRDKCTPHGRRRNESDARDPHEPNEAWVTTEQRLQRALGPLDLVHQLVARRTFASIRRREISRSWSDIR